jgi:hypothetical protein
MGELHTIFKFSAENAKIADWVAERSHFELWGDFRGQGPDNEYFPLLSKWGSRFIADSATSRREQDGSSPPSFVSDRSQQFGWLAFGR